MLALKLMAIGNSVGFVLPTEVVVRLKVETGDTVFLTETPDGYRLTAHDPAFEGQMGKAREITRRRQAALYALADEHEKQAQAT